MTIAPALSEESIAARLRSAFGIEALAFAPLAGGADLSNAVFRVTATQGAYFVKLRAAPANDSALFLARFLADSGIEAVVAPVATGDGRLADDLGPRRLIVYPWIEGVLAAAQPMTDAHWVDLGRSLRSIHDTIPTDALAASMRKEAFSPRWRDKVGAILDRPPATASPIGGELLALLRSNVEAIRSLLAFAAGFAALLGGRAHAAVPCHGDLHAANVILAGSRVHIVDWDDPLLAARERDLMFIGAGVCGVWTDSHETGAFHHGYGPVETDPALLAYYRCERVVEDIGVTCDELLDPAGDTRRQSLVIKQLADQFESGHVVEIALRTAAEAGAA